MEKNMEIEIRIKRIYNARTGAHWDALDQPGIPTKEYLYWLESTPYKEIYGMLGEVNPGSDEE